MAWTPLKTNYVDAVFDGLRKYQQLANQDGTYSFADVTQYKVKEGAFIGAKDINAMNVAMNLIMAALNNGTSLYDVFTQYFQTQQTLFQQTADSYNDGFEDYLSDLRTSVMTQCTQLQTDYTKEITDFKDEQETDFTAWYNGVKQQCTQLQTDYTAEITQFENVQETAFNTWFSFIKNQLTDDAAGRLQEEITNLTGQLETAEGEIESAKTEIESAKTEIASLTERLTAAEQDSESLRVMLVSGNIHAGMETAEGDTICTADGAILEAQWYLATM